jgi:plasmid stabilization system protein ParE
MEIVWTDTALETYLKVVDYLFDYWTIKEVEVFAIDVDQLIERIATFDQICPESKLLGYRKCVIDKYNSLVYHTLNDKLLLVTFIDNRSQHLY